MEAVTREAALEHENKVIRIAAALPPNLSQKMPLQHSWDNVPFQSGDSFVARSHELEFIQRALRPPSSTGSTRIVVLYGLSGMGKSQTALRYAHIHKADFATRFWIPCDTLLSRSQGFQKIAELLGLDASNASQSQVLVKDWLNNTGKPPGGCL